MPPAELVRRNSAPPRLEPLLGDAPRKLAMRTHQSLSTNGLSKDDFCTQDVGNDVLSFSIRAGMSQGDVIVGRHDASKSNRLTIQRDCCCCCCCCRCWLSLLLWGRGHCLMMVPWLLLLLLLLSLSQFFDEVSLEGGLAASRRTRRLLCSKGRFLVGISWHLVASRGFSWIS